MGFGIHNYIDPPLNYITILRNPIERVVSLYYFILRREKHYLYKKVKGINLYEFVTADFSKPNQNIQTRFLSTQDPRNFNQKETISSDDLKKAKNHLKKYFSLIGILEKYDMFINMLSKLYKWDINNYKKQNVTPNRPKTEELEEKTLNKIKELNKYDIELYEYAKELFEKQLKSYTDR
ncbi:MAG: sulfotransferase family 2 domain-containing protein [Spirochaetota bacterium]